MYDAATLTAKWTLTTPIIKDQVEITLSGSKDLDSTPAGGKLLDADWKNPDNNTDSSGSYFPSGNLNTGNNGGAFVFRFTVLPGDFNRDNNVDGSDFGIWNANKFTSPALPSVKYSLVELGDATGDGFVDGSDFGIWNANKFTGYNEWSGAGGGMMAQGNSGSSPNAAWLASYSELTDRYRIFRNGHVNQSVSQARWQQFADELMALFGQI